MRSLPFRSSESTRTLIVDPAADILALGALAYGALTGHAPLMVETVDEHGQDHRDAAVTPPSTDLPPELNRILLRALAMSPEDRHSNALDLASERAAHELDENVLERLRKAFAAWAEERVAAFVAGSSLAMPADWAECDERVRFRELDAVRRRWAGYPDMDFHVVRSSHAWLPLPDDALSPGEREDVIRFVRTALGIVTARPLADLSRRDHQYPQDGERWVLERAGAAVLQLRAEERPELLWQPVLDLHGEGHDWPEVFAHSLHRHALFAEQTPASYTALVRLMVQRAFTEVEGKRRWSSHEAVWDALLGIDWYSRDVWESRHAGIVEDLRDVFTLWMEKVPLNGGRLSGFAAWLCRPAAAPIRLRTLNWILERVRVDERHQLRDVEEAEDAIAVLLNLVWGEEQALLRSDAEAFAAFRGLLSWLGDRQNHLGLELLGRIGSLG